MKFCQNCGQRPSSYVFETNMLGERRNICLCEQCAKKMGLIEEKSAYEKNLFENSNVKRCPTCHTTEDDFIKYGFAGCKDCYYNFASSGKVVENWQGAARHNGKTSANGVSPEAKMEILLKKFKLAIAQNNLQEATKLKKEIQILGESRAKK